MDNLRLLLIEDNEGDAFLIEEYLADIGQNYNISSYRTLKEGITALQENSCDLILLDLSLPDAIGTSGFDELNSLFSEIPIIILTGNTNVQLAETLVSSGAQDYLLKDEINGSILDKAIRYARARNSAERELAATRERLNQYQKMQAIGQLAGGLAHDFNNMMTAIIGYCSYLLEVFGEENEYRYDISEIKSLSMRAADLTKELLTFSRSRVLNPKVENVNLIIRNMENILRRYIREDINFELLLSDGDIRVKIDVSQFEQVLVNLIVNAKDAMPNGGLLSIISSVISGHQISSIATNQGSLATNYLCLAVSDTGIGMDRETVDRIFEPFFTTKSIGQGTGLGLATVYGTIHQSDGFIDVQSEVGKGTTFNIYIPCFVEEIKGENTEYKSKENTIPSKINQLTYSVLIVDDQYSVGTIIAKYLEKKGYKAIQASSSQEVLEYLVENKNNIDLLLTDIVMPEINGIDLANIVRKQNSNIKILLMSAYSNDPAIRGKIDSHGYEFIEKPFDYDDLQLRISSILQGE